MRRLAMTLTEVLMGLAIMSILAGVMTLNSATVGQQTARREAERVAGFLRSHILRAKMTHDVLWFDSTQNYIQAKTGMDVNNPMKTETLNVGDKCSFPSCEPSPFKLVYNKTNMGEYKTISANASIDIGAVTTTEITTTDYYRLTVKGADGKYCNVLISKTSTQ